MPSIRTRVGPWLAARRRSALLAFGARVARVYLEVYENHDYEPESNGEAWLLQRFAGTQPSVVFDVGANVGDWTAEALSATAAQIHAFELVPHTAARLEARFARDARVTVNKIGMLDEPGIVRVKHYPAFSAASSVNDFPHPLDHEWIEAPATTGDTYGADKGIERIDFLKIDAEGSDHRVLQGFSAMLAQGVVDLVQFEYGRAAIRNHFLLADFYEFFEQFDMQIGKLYPRYVDFRAYNINRHEDFLGPNYVAVKRTRPDLVRLLSDPARVAGS
jgi:FkbM family methyltransferase